MVKENSHHYTKFVFQKFVCEKSKAFKNYEKNNLLRNLDLLWMTRVHKLWIPYVFDGLQKKAQKPCI